jgi:hypothetical protein
VHGDCMGSVGVGVGKSGERNRAKQRCCPAPPLHLCLLFATLFPCVISPALQGPDAGTGAHGARARHIRRPPRPRRQGVCGSSIAMRCFPAFGVFSIVDVQCFVVRRGVVCSIVLQAKEGATTVQLFAARKGKGIVAGSKVRCHPPPRRYLSRAAPQVKAVLRAAGVKDCIAKVITPTPNSATRIWSHFCQGARQSQPVEHCEGCHRGAAQGDVWRGCGVFWI